MKLLSGYILARPGEEKINRQELEVKSDDNAGVFSLTYKQIMPIGKSWELFDFFSSIPLPDDNQSPDAKPNHSCEVVICRSRSRMLLLTERKKIADFIIEKLLNVTLYPNFRKVPIAIDSFIEACSTTQSPYAITSMHGRFSGAERALRTIILYGEEITDSSLFREHGKKFNFYSAGVKRRLVDKLYRSQPNDDTEIIRLGNDGMVSANLRDSTRATEILTTIKYIFDNNWVDDWAKGH